ncbi:1,4-dihydroxy-2-naphthoate polyprenyltransferase [Halocalculus aciditolerans]|uniref:1,4-dihydroxy-2-naphthoate octaprenyltransferase n=1 Tax=Halocalculus aciditolerans TaxID=1383812 RepID=A0A830FIS5_9EURY|nr:1,4-dihydroxy-2-naphthoate polyprenyltransferase [Halocalculus aciditolerans]GGL56945.1 1,4-dihydroxy-2-naphthoate polyprenyltransferase [Halocalculus aciditolerans]
MSDSAEISRTQAWVMAARPHTLPAASSPVLVGVGLALGLGVFEPLPAVAALVGALLIQVGTNFANDYYDAEKGADTEEREGFTRVTQAGLIPAQTVKRAMYATFLASVVVGLYLVAVGGVPILVIGVLSILSGIAYTGGPYPLGYHGLGDVFVFVFFGVVAVVGTVYVQAAAAAAGVFPVAPPAGTLPTAAFAASVAVGTLNTAILVVNNLRDVDTDRKAGKNTLAVRFGRTGARAEYVLLLVVAYLVPVYFFVSRAGWDAAVLLPLLTLPLAATVTRTVLRYDDGEHLDPALSTTGKLLFAFAALFAVGLAL